jgi:hypothetical protein
MMEKNWDFPASSSDRKARAREADLYILLTEEQRYAVDHEALRRIASLLVEAVDDVLDRMRSQADADGDDPDDVRAVYEDERPYHLSRLAKVLIAEAVAGLKKP